ncbi:hypothetical protein LTR08_007971 [Meristemomyces frigidus]|nr:hypothetical protein LTR08_007971 [Meristemomyces frigidus]
MAKKRRASARLQQAHAREDVDASAGADDVSDGKTSTQQPDTATICPGEIDVEHFEISHNDKTVPCERRGKAGKPSLIFTHGAGGGLGAPAAKDFADGFAAKASIVSFKGAMNLPSRTKTFHAVMEHEDFDAALGGRSMGARAACIAATQQDRQTKALVLVSFPLVGGKRQESRAQILLDLPESVDVLFISGTRDTMCDVEQLEGVISRMASPSWLVTIDAANHGMDWKWKESAQMKRLTGAIAANWLESRDKSKRRCLVRWDEEVGGIKNEGWKEGEEGDQKEPKKDATEADLEESPPVKKRKTRM